MRATNWYVITGAPSSGKTAVIDVLAARGHRVVPEAARALIDARLAAGLDLAAIKADVQAFERAILAEKLRVEAELPAGELIFLDRAVPDSIAYFRLEGLDAAEAEAACGQVRYRGVFLFEPLPFRRDRVRSEDAEQAARLDRLLADAYRRLGYRLRRVPVLPVEERADWVLAHL